jgi:organic radical activating enzyme
MKVNRINGPQSLNFTFEESFWKEFGCKYERQNYWRTLFESKFELQRLKDGLPATKPIYLEMHPYHQSQDLLCTNDCVWCTRGDEREIITSNKIPGINPDHLLTFIRQLKGKIHEGILLSGNCTEPLLYPRIDELVHVIKKTGFRLRVYSNFFYGERLLQTIKQWDERDYLRVSLDGFNDNAYRITHRPRFSDAFSKTLSNLEKICQKRDSTGHHFGIGLTWLLTKSNADLKDIKNAVQWVDAHQIQSIRFRVPVTPLIGKKDFCATDSLLGVEELFKLDIELKALKRRFKNVNLQLLEEPAIHPNKPFTNCHYYRIMSVLGATGRFFPCTSVSLATTISPQLNCSNVNDNDFNYIKVRNDLVKHWSRLDPKICCGSNVSECTRFEYSVNEWLHQLTKSDSQAGTTTFDPLHSAIKRA